MAAPKTQAIESGLDSILRNSSLLMGAKIVSSAVGMVVMVLLPRLLGDAEFGRLHLAISLTALFGAAADFGLARVITRAVACDRATAWPYLRQAALLSLLLGAGLYATLPVTVHALGYPARVGDLVLILGVGMIVDTWAQLTAALFQAHEQMLVPAVARIAGTVVMLGLVLGGLRHFNSVMSVAAVLVLASVVRLAIQALAIRRLEGFRIPTRAETLPWRRLLVAGLPFLAWQGLGLFYFRLDVIMLGRMTSDATVGWYGAGSRLLESFTFIPDLLMAAMLPVVARLWTTSPTQFQAASQKTLDLLLVATIPLVVVLLTLADPIVDLLFGAGQFGPSIPILRIKALTLAFLFVDYYLATILIAVGRERRWLLLAVAACFVSPALNWVLIPLTDARYGNGGVGAAVATLVTEIFIMISAIRLTPRDAFGPASWRVGLQATGAGVAAGAVILLGLALKAPWIPVGIAGGITYVALVLYLGLVPEDVLYAVRSALTGHASTEMV